MKEREPLLDTSDSELRRKARQAIEAGIGRSGASM
jgi:hypothetical protein